MDDLYNGDPPEFSEQELLELERSERDKLSALTSDLDPKVWDRKAARIMRLADTHCVNGNLTVSELQVSVSPKSTSERKQTQATRGQAPGSARAQLEPSSSL